MTDHVELTSPDGYRAEVSTNDWPIVRFGKAKRLVIEYDQKNGEHKRYMVYDDPNSDLGVGAELPVEGRSKGHSWVAEVTSSKVVGRVTVEYTTKGGKDRRKDLFTDDELPGYFEERPDGSAVFMRFR